MLPENKIRSLMNWYKDESIRHKKRGNEIKSIEARGAVMALRDVLQIKEQKEE